ncbi:MAG: alanine racemase, partial [Saprospiraceae bacterium]|nr:alanine racemase [Saprospiraceae bacterium]
RIRGLMGMATFTDDMDIVREEFETLKELFEDLQKKYFDPANFNELSMGMSGDYRMALEQGATMVRIGSRIFGPREQ